MSSGSFDGDQSTPEADAELETPSGESSPEVPERSWRDDPDLSLVERTVEGVGEMYFSFCRRLARYIRRIKRRS